ncbi:MAG: hypothetical protein HYY02_01870 [Chloroflexi bacterium]|nr:hypothetical protein [Chloroflexota bacterium]
MPPDPLGVREATAAVVAQARHVRIAPEAAETLARRWASEGVGPPGWYPKHHFFDGTHRSANWLLALDAVNFSFWSQDPAERWEIDYRGERLDGYWALAASLTRAVEEGAPLWDARTLAELTQGDVYRIFRGKGVIPLMADRLNNLREAGQALLDRYRGQFIHAITAAEGSAARLVALLARDFPSFRDVAEYGGQPVPLYKRAQLLVSDLWGAYGGRSWGAFSDMEALTAFADYKLPQMLREQGVLEYSPELARKVDTRALILAGSPEEVEMRAATVQACELLRDALAEAGVPLMAFQVDWLLWQQSQGVAAQHPYHLTRTIYY